ncbi:MAG: type IV pilus assembly protein PilM [Patescibacteria group bacterium]|nr:type IV pilus assembly protein PilM [Patescibacteria group bacterium]MDD5555045.1 type IV pilus assembly protein PilM [Patescibacteria group bacterium]
MSLFSREKSHLGIDIGTAGIKIVELEKGVGGLRLLTYGFTENLGEIERKDWQNDAKYTAKIINEVCRKAKTVSRSAVAALPAFSVFSSIINLANVDQKDFASAVHWEAKKVIPLPLEEMVLDWKKIESGEQKDKNVKILLTGAPKALVKKYISIFKEAQISLLSLETETFSLIRALLGSDKSTIMIVEVGMSTTDISIINKGIPVLSRSIDVGGLAITKAISNNLGVGSERAEQFKYDLGISSSDSSEEIVPKAIAETISPIINEIKYMLNLFESKNSEKKVEKLILSGGSSLLPNFVNYLSKIFDMNIIIGDPWSRVSYPVDLGPVIAEIGPKLSVAIGLAMRETK